MPVPFALNGQFPLRDAIAREDPGNEVDAIVGNCIHQDKYPVHADECNDHDSLYIGPSHKGNCPLLLYVSQNTGDTMFSTTAAEVWASWAEEKTCYRK